MLSLALASAIAIPPVDGASRTAAARSAQATVRIVRGAEIRGGKPARFEASVVRAASVRERDGSVRNATLVEFY